MKFRSELPTPKQGKTFTSIYVHKHSGFQVQPPCSFNLSPPDFYLWKQLKTLVYSAPIENEETFYQCIFDACQTTYNCPGIFERV
jgi:hypothetical protein